MDELEASGENLLRGVAADTAVVMLEVVPVEVRLVPLTGVGRVFELARIVRRVLQRLELALVEGIFVAGARAAVVADDAQLM